MGTQRFDDASVRCSGRTLLACGALLFAANAIAATLQVGPARAYKLPSDVAAVARDGDIVEIDTGSYDGDVAVWRQNRLTIRGVGGRIRLDAKGRAAEDKAIWVIKGRDIVIENVEFIGARVPDENGAGIRAEGENLTVRNCYFHHNENGLLGGAGDVIVEFSEFANNGFGDGQSHNMYISERTRRFVLRGSYSHGANVGHNVKSRAKENRIVYNRITDTPGNSPSYSIDLPNGGLAFVVGNVIQQGPEPENSTLVSYGAEGVSSSAPAGLYVVNNTFINEYRGGVFVRNMAKNVVARIVNNIFVGTGKISVGPAESQANWNGRDPGFISETTGDYRLRRDAVVIDRGVDPGTAAGFDLVPQEEYRHPVAVRLRRNFGKLDLGAYEFTGAGEN